MKRYKLNFSIMLRLLLIVAVIGVSMSSRLTPTAQAGKEGVFVSSDVYFTLEEASVSQGADTQTLRFAVQLVNNSSDIIDFNQYGVRVQDGEGSTYSASLSEKSVARVQGNQSQTYRYSAQLPANLSADNLKVVLFAWSFSGGVSTKEIGAFSVSNVLPAGVQKQQISLNLGDIDASLPDNSPAVFEISRSYKSLSGGNWILYVDVLVQNNGTTSTKIPSGLSFGIKDSNQLSYTATVVFGGDQIILPRQKSLIVLQAPIGSTDDNNQFFLEIMKKTTTETTTKDTNSNTNSTSTSSSTITNLTLLGTASLKGTFHTTAAGESIAVSSKAANSLSMSVSDVRYENRSDGLRVEGTFIVKNDTKVVLGAPTLTGQFQIGGTTLAVTATETAQHPAFLSPAEKTEYSFAATLPAGADPSSVELVVLEKKSSTVSTPVLIGKVPPGEGTSGGSTDAGLGVLTPAGTLSFNVKATYRLATEADEDVLMSEIEVKNLESTTVTIPSLYGGYKIDDVDLKGSAVKLQTSSYLSPGQKTTIYVYSKLSYMMEVGEGKLYLGDGVFDTKTSTWSSTHLWTELPITVNPGSIRTSELGKEWMISDPGRISTAQVVDNKIYVTDTQKILALRIQQQNKDSRNGNSVSYIGYVTDGEGTVWTAKTAEETGKLSKDAYAMSTLWVSVPLDMPTEKLSFVFGQKLGDGIFATAGIYAFSPVQDQNNLEKYHLNVGMNPYTLDIQNPTLVYTSKKIDINFDYNLTKGLLTTGAYKDRSITLELVYDNNDHEKVESWDIPLEGTGALKNGKNTVSLDPTKVKDLIYLLSYSKLNVYEKFEGGTRLLGTMTVVR